jgi:hypothetical protein
MELTTMRRILVNSKKGKRKNKNKNKKNESKGQSLGKGKKLEKAFKCLMKLKDHMKLTSITTGKWRSFVGFFKFVGSDEYNSN